MDGEGALIQVALELKAGFTNKLIVFRLMLDRLVAKVSEEPHRLEIKVKDRFRFRKQTRSLGCGPSPEIKSQSQRSEKHGRADANKQSGSVGARHNGLKRVTRTGRDFAEWPSLPSP